MVAQVSELTAADKAIVKAFAENRMRVNKAAMALGMAFNNVHYHLGRVKEKTGYDPLDFWSLVTLLQMIGDQE